MERRVDASGVQWRLIASAANPRAVRRVIRTPSHDLVVETINMDQPNLAIDAPAPLDAIDAAEPVLAVAHDASDDTSSDMANDASDDTASNISVATVVPLAND